MKTFDPIHRARCNQHSFSSDKEYRSILSSARKDLRAYDAEVARLQNAIDFLESEKASLKGYVLVCGSLEAPARRLPREILLHIFQYIQPQVWIQCGSVGATLMPPAMGLASVSHYWRDIVSSAPQLWANVLLDVLDYSKDTHSQVMPWLEGIVLRAKAVPLTLELDVRAQAISHSPEEAQILFSYLRNLMSRTRNIHCGWVFADIVPSSSMACLESVALLATNITSPSDTWTRINLSQLAPNLSKLHIHAQSSFPVFNHAKITELKISMVPVSLVAPALDSCTALRTLEMGPLFDEGQDFRPIEIVLPALSNLVIADNGSSLPDRAVNISRILSMLTLPRLSKLCVKDAEPLSLLPPPSHFSKLADLIARSRCDVVHFSCFGSQSLGISSLISFLSSQTPSLQSLSVGYPEKNAAPGGLDPLLEFLSHGQPSSGIHATHHLPQIYTLQITAPRKSFDDHKFVDLVKSRWRPQDMDFYAHAGATTVSCIQSIDLVVKKGKFSDELWEPLRRRQMHGLRVSVRDKRGCVRTRWEQSQREDESS